MKKIEITPEWILDKFIVHSQADGHGNITLISECFSDSRWIDLALTTLGVTYVKDELEHDPDPEDPDDGFFFEIHWEFKIEDIKDDCPILYAKWTKMDLLNSSFEFKN